MRVWPFCLTPDLSSVNPTTGAWGRCRQGTSMSSHPSCCQSPLKTRKVRGPWEVKAAPCHLLPTHSMLGSPCCTPSLTLEDGLKQRHGQGKKTEVSGKKPAGGIWGTCRVENSARWQLAGLDPGGAWSCSGLQVEAECSERLHVLPQGHTAAAPSTARRSLHLGSGQVASSARGRGHSTGARATEQGDRLTGQAWLPGHLPSLGVGGSRPGPTIG